LAAESKEEKLAREILYADKPWLQHYDEGVPSKMTYEEICLPEMLERSTERFPNHKALIFQGFKMNYRELRDMVNRFATCLDRFGVKKGDSVSILLPNLIPCVVAYFAVLKIGAVAVLNNPLYSDRELKHQFNDSASKVLITLDLLAQKMVDLRPKTGIRQIVYTSIGDYLPIMKNILFPLIARKHHLSTYVRPAPDLYSWKEVLKKNPPKPPYVKLDFEDVAMYQYTGGTTGISKGVLLTHGNLSRQVQQVFAWYPQFNAGEETMMGALPFFHVFGLTTSMNLSICAGWTNILIPKPQPEPLLEVIRKFRPTFAPLVPTMYIGMLNHPMIDEVDLTCIKGCFSGSAPLPMEVIRDFEAKTGAVIVEGFGLTETSPVTHINPFAGQRKVGSIGVPISDTECRIVSLEDGKTDVPVGENGELLVRGPQIMKEYWNMPGETANVLTHDGWLHTGDIARMDEDGYFFIMDRKKDMIISGGLNVYPREIEEVLYEHFKIKEACCVGIPHPHRGEAVKVFVVLREGEKIKKEELLEYCRSKMSKFKWPVEIEFRDELPKTNVGKILRKNLREEELLKAGK